MNKKFLLLLVIVVAVVAIFIFRDSSQQGAIDHKNAEYVIDGQKVRLKDGVAYGTMYFGNEVVEDLNGDGRKDVAFILTNTGWGSGTFYYVVAALNTEKGYIGSEGFFLGDRIAPQTTESGTGIQLL